MKMSRSSVPTSGPVADASSSVCAARNRIFLPPVAKSWDLVPRILSGHFNEFPVLTLPHVTAVSFDSSSRRSFVSKYPLNSSFKAPDYVD